MTSEDGQWEFWIDRGGTFTDVVARDPSGRIHIHKLLSESPEQYRDAPLEAVRRLLKLTPDDSIPPHAVRAVKMGTTLATNALLERKGARVGLLVTKGFRDLLEIGYQNRPNIFALEIKKPELLTDSIIEIDERVLADGTVRKKIDERAVRNALEEFQSNGIGSLAVLFLHSFAYPDHERAVESAAQEMGFAQISLSHRTAREIKAVGRGDTTVADAYLTPIMRDYIDALRSELGREPRLRFMQSSGGLVDADRFSGKDAILSGPAGGVVAYAHVCRAAGFDKAIGFDMGGTSTDVSRYDGAYERIFEKPVAGVRIKAPMLHIETVAAGGGSILQFDQGRFLVGPESAGANPGPACYRLGGPAAVTDANAVLGRVQPNYFSACFGPKADQPLDIDASRKRLEEIRSRLRDHNGSNWTLEEIAAGFVRIANENMAKPIKSISVSRGYDVQEYALACFGGAGAQHACAIAQSLGIRTILIHPYAGVLSAYGMGLADLVYAGVKSILRPLSDTSMADLDPEFRALEEQTSANLREEGFDESDIQTNRSVDLRYQGVDTYLNVPLGDDMNVREIFESEHQTLFGFTKPDHPVEIVNIRVECAGLTTKPSEPKAESESQKSAAPLETDTVFFDVLMDDGSRKVQPLDTSVYRRTDLQFGHRIDGPAIVVEEASTIVVDPGWTASVNEYNHLVLTASKDQGRERIPTERDPVLLEVFNNLFMSIAEQMGKTLERVSHSVNIKERLDFSCALFSPDGDLVANAPHMPVHLGAMGVTVRALLEARGGELRPGDVYVTNDPYKGGSHLPDVTVITPVFDDHGERIFVVANRGHHADIGGKTPGSMPAFSESLHDEGVVLSNLKLVSNGQFLEDEIVDALTNHPHPARNLSERLSDLRAQIAANNRGVNLLSELCERYGLPVVHAYMGHVRDNANEAMREAIRALPDGERVFEDQLDEGEKIRCKITVKDDQAKVDFTGTSPELAYNLNAPPAIVYAAVLYVFRTLIGKDIPLNAGCLDAIEVVIPEGSLLNPTFPAPVAGGNVETSMRVVDALYGALGVLAAGQGTMNSLTFGNERFGYYETICGGAGAGPGFNGASAVHTHMTNTRITDPEVLEHRYPVVLREFSIRRGTGGQGDFTGGDGVTRAIEFLEPMSVTILSERRTVPPYGVNGANPGACGENLLIQNGAEHRLKGRDTAQANAGDTIVIQTPGGGGYNRKNDQT